MSDESDRVLAQIKAKLDLLDHINGLWWRVGDDSENDIRRILERMVREIGLVESPPPPVSAIPHSRDGADAEPDEPTILVSRKKLEELKKDKARWEFLEERTVDLYYYPDKQCWKLVDQGGNRRGESMPTARETVDSAMKV